VKKEAMTWIQLCGKTDSDLILVQELDGRFMGSGHRHLRDYHCIGTADVDKESFVRLRSTFPMRKWEVIGVAVVFTPLVKPDYKVQALVHRIRIESQLTQRPITIPGDRTEAVRFSLFIPAESIRFKKREIVVEPATVGLPGQFAFDSARCAQYVPQKRLGRLQGPSVRIQQYWKARE